METVGLTKKGVLPMWDIAQTYDYIQSFQKRGKPVQDLSRIKALLESLGNPRAVHVVRASTIQ